jgi:hypothetical protein
VHRYDTADLRVDGNIIRLAVAWRVEPHLSVKDIDGVPNLALNATSLCADLFKAFAEYREQLVESAEARDRFLTRYRETGCTEITVPAQVEAWKLIVKDVSRYRARPGRRGDRRLTAPSYCSGPTARR